MIKYNEVSLLTTITSMAPNRTCTFNFTPADKAVYAANQSVDSNSTQESRRKSAREARWRAQCALLSRFISARNQSDSSYHISSRSRCFGHIRGKAVDQAGPFAFSAFARSARIHTPRRVHPAPVLFCVIGAAGCFQPISLRGRFRRRYK